MSRQKQTTSPQTLAGSIEHLRRAGFSAEERGPGRVLVSKHGCGAVLEEVAGQIRFVEGPGLLMGQSIARLVDRGFQKFWQNGSQQRPALAGQLKSLHNFQQDLRAVLGQTTLYNEALGTVSARYVYDRLKGREAS